jgi:hypothetical protein
MSLGGQSADEDAQFYDYHIDHFQIAFEEWWWMIKDNEHIIISKTIK